MASDIQDKGTVKSGVFNPIQCICSVRTRQEALRVALDEFDAEDNNAAGRKVKSGGRTGKGGRLFVATKVTENRKVTTTPDERKSRRGLISGYPDGEAFHGNSPSGSFNLLTNPPPDALQVITPPLGPLYS